MFLTAPVAPGARGAQRCARTLGILQHVIEADALELAKRIRNDFRTLRKPVEPEWRRTPAAKVIDCVLSLRKKYQSVVVPRVKQFGVAHPEVETCGQLYDLIQSFDTPEIFVARDLEMNSARKATMLVGVLDYLLDVQRRFDGATESDRLRLWAKWARPGDYLTLDVSGFGLAGFQYLRVLFGADTVKPDAHVLRYVENVLGRPIAGRREREVQAVYSLERAGKLLDKSVRSIDVAIWEHSSGDSLSREVAL